MFYRLPAEVLYYDNICILGLSINYLEVVADEILIDHT